MNTVHNQFCLPCGTEVNIAHIFHNSHLSQKPAILTPYWPFDGADPSVWVHCRADKQTFKGIIFATEEI